MNAGGAAQKVALPEAKQSREFQMKPSSFKTVFSLLIVLCAPALIHSGAAQRPVAPNATAAASFHLATRPSALGEPRAMIATGHAGTQAAAWFRTTSAEDTLFKK